MYSGFVGDLQSLFIAPLTSPGTIGASSVLSRPTNSWERVGDPVNEGPAAMYHGGKTYLAFSASYCGTTSYSLGLLTWDGRSDPARESSWSKTGPVFSSANGNYGTAHNGFVTFHFLAAVLLLFITFPLYLAKTWGEGIDRKKVLTCLSFYLSCFSAFRNLSCFSIPSMVVNFILSSLFD